MKTNVGTFLKQTVGNNEFFYFHPNPGNAGDSLINVGCYDCFNHNGLGYKEFSDGLTCDVEQYRDQIVVLGGGGGFVPTWSFTHDFIKRFHEVCKLLVILPHTVSGNEELLQQLGDNVVIFAREEKSLEHLRANLTNGAIVKYANDMAFSVDLNKIKNIVKPRLKFKHEIKNVLNEFRGRAFLFFNKNKLNAFRNDAEKTEIAIPKFNYDISIAYSFGTKDELHNRYSAYKFLEYINLCSEVSTNRLHGAIGSALLGKKVNFYANNYFKCRAVYEASIKQEYKHVKWME